jgi:alpha-L-fucosidase 2
MRKSLNSFLVVAITMLSATAVSHAVTVITCVGNSVTMTTQYPEALQVKLGSTYKVYNEGVGGAGITGWSRQYITCNGVDQTQTNFTDIFKLKPQIITIKLGVNDTHAPASVLETDFVPGYNKLIDTFLTISPKPKIYLILPAPMYPPEQQAWCDNLKNEIVPLTRKIATQRNLPLVDFYTPLLGHPEYFPNSVHANAGSPPADSMTNILYRTIMASTAVAPNQVARPAIAGLGVNANAFGLSVTAPERTAWTLDVTALDGRSVARYSGCSSARLAFDKRANTTRLLIARLRTANGETTQTIARIGL